jgi:regulator of CtrA degradation
VIANHSRMHRRLIDSLYVESMLLADEARGYFDDAGRDDRDALVPLSRVIFSCESMKVTTRLMHVIAWLLTQRAVAAGELAPRDALDPSRRLGEGPDTDDSTVATLPDAAKVLVVASMDLHRRVARFDKTQGSPRLETSPVEAMQQRLAMAF